MLVTRMDRLPTRVRHPRRCLPRSPARQVPTENVLPAGPTDRAPRALTAADQDRVREHLWVAEQVAWQFARSHARDVPIDELNGEALYGLTYAAALYDADRRVPFLAYAERVIRHCLFRRIQTWRRERWVRPPAGEEVGETEDRRPAPDRARDLCEQVRRALPARLYEVLHLYHAQGHTLREIGARLGVTQARVRQMLNKAAAVVRERFPNGVGEP
jgi:RNA polymerase sigma factor FliA